MSLNHNAFVAFITRWEEDGVAKHVVLDFVEVPKVTWQLTLVFLKAKTCSQAHTGKNLAEAAAKVVNEFGIAHKILGLTCDNASNNDTMVAELEKLIPSFGVQRAHSRCLAHILNLVAKLLLAMFDQKKTKGKGDGDNGEGDDRSEDVDIKDILTQLGELKQGTPERDDPDNFDDPFTDMDEEDKERFLKETKAVSLALAKVRSPTMSSDVANFKLVQLCCTALENLL